MSSKPHSVSGVHQAFEVFRLGLAGLVPDSRDGSADQDNIRRAFKKIRCRMIANALTEARSAVKKSRAACCAIAHGQQCHADRKTQPVPWSGAQ